MPTAPRSLKQLFLEALAVPPAERAAWMARECADNPALTQQIELMLAAHVAPQSLLDRLAPPVASPGPVTEQYAPESVPPGTTIGPYKLLQQIGEGGMGVVYMAEQSVPVERRVALKIIKPGMDTRQVIARFEAERQALAMMDHPNIAKVFDAGTTRGEPGGVSPGSPYFVMELVRGIPITKYCDEHQLTLKQRLELFIPVCHAVQHAHQKGVIHRDLKPSNVLVAQYDDKPVPKVIDFGVAKAAQKLTDRTMFTEFGQVVGTLEYMSPEQATFNQLDIDTRSDIYSLGVLLYELLTGCTPFDGQRLRSAAFDEMLRIIREEEPPKPSTRLSGAATLPSIAASRNIEPMRLSRAMRGELDWIVMKALEKDRNRRYETTNGLARDIERYLRDEPVQACPPSALYRFRKMAQRNKRAFVTVTMLVLAIAAVLGSFGWAVRERVVREASLQAEVDLALQEAEQWQEQAKWQEALSAVKRAEGLLAGSEIKEARERAHQTRKQLEMIIALEAYRAQRTNLFFNQPQDSGYARLFAEHGVDVENLSPSEVAAQITRWPATAIAVASALDDWAQETQDPATVKRLLEAARLADPDAWRTQLRQLMGKQDLDALRKLAAEAEMSTLPVQSLQLMGNALAFAGDSPACIAWLRRAHRQYPGDSRVSFDLALHLSEHSSQGNSKAVDLVDGLRFAEAALASRPSPDLHQFVGGILLQLGRHDEAIASARKAIEIAPRFNWDRRGLCEAYTNLGEALVAQQKPEEAIPYFHKSIELKPTDWAYKSLGEAYAVQGKLDEAIDCYYKSIKLNPEWDWPHCNLGDALAAQGKLDDAIVYYRKAIELDPEWSWPRLKLGDVLRRNGDAAGAVDAYRKGIALAPDDSNLSDAYKKLGEALHVQGELDDAIVNYRKAIELNPQWAWPPCNLGDALAAQGKPDDAIVYYRKAIELNSEWDWPRLRLASVLESQAWALATDSDPEKRAPGKAVILAKEAVELAPNEANYSNTLGVAHYRAGHWQDAISALQRFRELRTHDGESSNPLFLAMAHWQSGNKEEARQWYDKGVAWMKKNQHPEDLLRFRVEAAELMTIETRKD